jgi:hypothetical protein
MWVLKFRNRMDHSTTPSHQEEVLGTYIRQGAVYGDFGFPLSSYVLSCLPSIWNVCPKVMIRLEEKYAFFSKSVVTS